ncbi:DUF4097 family beta strand repeat-containing protein [Angustibacter sp. McL0619]|uniref:DUF4097 family beta strand repeat-containing protein n=1 Tax=Angustibacter sp. McL0619 TaxID=3415676 RepID=UPI003CF1A4AF
MTVQDVPQQTQPEGAPPPAGSARPLLIGLGIAFAVLSVLAGTMNIIGSIGRDSAQRQASYQGIRVVEVDVGAESVQIVAGTDDVTRLDRTISWSLTKPSFSERQEGDHLVIRSSCGIDFGRGCSGKVHLVVPADVQVTAHSSAGYVGVTGLTGALDLSSSAGHVDGVRLGSANVQADSSAGSVELSFSTAPTSVKATSSAGSVAVLLPQGDEAYRVEADSSAGSSDVSVRTDPSSSRTIVAHSSGGSVDVSYAE